MRLGVIRRDPRERALGIDAREAHERRDQVDVAGRRADPAGDGGNAGTLHDHWYAGRLVVRVAPLLLQPTVRAEQIPVVGGEHDDRVISHARRPRETSRIRPNRLIDQLLQVVVQAAIRHVGRLFGGHRGPDPLELLLTRGPTGERVGLRRSFRNIGHRVVGRVEAEQRLVEPARERDVVGIHERRDREPRPVARRAREVTEELDDLLREHTVADRPAVGLRNAVRLAADPT